MSRRERNENFEQEHLTPELEYPEYGEYLIEWYFSISNRLQRVIDGVCVPIPPSEFLAWMQLTGNLVRHNEYDILSTMDLTFCEVMNSELKDFRDREKDKSQNR